MRSRAQHVQCALIWQLWLSYQTYKMPIKTVWFDTNAYWIETNSVALEVFCCLFPNASHIFASLTMLSRSTKTKFIRINFVMFVHSLELNEAVKNVLRVRECVSSFNRIFRWKLFELILELQRALPLSLAPHFLSRSMYRRVWPKWLSIFRFTRSR